MEFAPAPTEHGSQSRLRALCLDVDDTLIDYTAASKAALAAMIGRADMWPLWEAITEEHAALVVAGRLDYGLVHRARTQRFLAELGVSVDDGDAARFERRRRALMYDRFRLFDDVLPCLRSLRASGLRVAAVTNASGAHQRGKLASLGIDGFFDCIVIAGEVGAAKPDPAIFVTACALLQAAPGETVHIGDRLGADVVGALAAGLGAVWLDRCAFGNDDFAGFGVPVIRSLSSLPGLLTSGLDTTAEPVSR